MIDFLLAIRMKIHQKNIIQLSEEKRVKYLNSGVYIIYKIKIRTRKMQNRFSHYTQKISKYFDL